jgi:GNAT superfamily N-acetyltransferase
MKVEILISPGKDVIHEIIGLRERVWISEEGLDRRAASAIGVTVEDKLDKSAIHFVVRDGGDLVGSARVSVHEDLHDVPASSVYRSLPFQALPPIGVFGRCVVLPDYRTNGVGAMLDLARFRKAAEVGCHTLLAYAHPERVETLGMLGFEPIDCSEMPPHSQWPAGIKRVALKCSLE